VMSCLNCHCNCFFCRSNKKCSIYFCFFYFSVVRLTQKLNLALKRNLRLKLRLNRARFDSRMKMKVPYLLRNRKNV